MPRLRFVSTVQGVSTIELNEPIVTIGRVANNVVCIEDPNISKHHTLLVSEDDTYKIYDLHSVNGTWVNGERITVTRLKEGDAVRIGYLELKFEIAAPVVPPRPVLVAPSASATATGPTTLAARPRLGLKSPGAPAPVIVPAAATATHAPVAVVQPLVTPPAPVKEEPRAVIQLPPEKKITGPTTPPPAPVVSAPPPAPASPMGGPPKLKTFSRESTPPPAPPAPAPAAPLAEGEPVPAETHVAPAAPTPTTGPKKFGAGPGGGPPKFKLKRE